MKYWTVIVGGLLFGSTVCGCSHSPPNRADAEWVTLLDGSSLDHWHRVGNANWRLIDGVVQADRGTGYLVSENTYGDFQIKAEFWVDDAANSGILIRLTDAKNITPANSYEVNIYDKRPDPSYGTGAIVDFAKVASMPKAGGRWNTFDITAKGPQLTVVLNGIRTVDLQDASFVRGPIALQYAAGVVKFRKVQIRPL